MNWVELSEIDVLSDGTAEIHARDPIAYKFVKAKVPAGSGASTQLNSPTNAVVGVSPAEEAILESREAAARPPIDFARRAQRPRFELSTQYAYEWRFDQKDQIQWEGNGSQDNRYIVSISGGRGYEIEIETLQVFREDRSAGTAASAWIFLPVADFLESSQSGLSEYIQTTRYYRTVKELRSIHFARVVDGLFVGSCPRSSAHIELLRDQLQVGCVFNFQSDADLVENWINDTDPAIKRNVSTLAEVYATKNVSLVHLPTVDMSTPARAGLMAQSACLMAVYARANPNKSIYVHCNAGVGRAVAGVLSFLVFVLRMPAGEAVAYLKQRRPMAYPDLVALTSAQKDFTNKYAAAL